MREQAHLIQREVSRLMEDMGRLRERVLDLQRHFGQANQDIEKILTSSERIASRGHRIESLEFEGDGASAAEGGHAAPLVAQPSAHHPAGNGGERRRPLVTRQPDLLAGE
jgi:DNA recombination protein RmuC